MKFSIIIPVYNAEETVERCIKSVTNQGYQDYEIICVDDGSTDGTNELLLKKVANNKKIKVIKHISNKGTCAAVKTGIRLAKGNYIQVLHADDMLSNRFFNVLDLKTNDNPDVDIFHFNFVLHYYYDSYKNKADYVIDKFINKHFKQKPFKPYYNKLYGEHIRDACFLENLYGWSIFKLFKAEVCKSALEFINDAYIPSAEDYYLYFIFSGFANVYWGVKDKLYVYSQGKGISSSKARTLDQFKRISSRANTIEALKEYCETMGIYEKYKGLIKKSGASFLNSAIKIMGNSKDKEFSEKIEVLREFWPDEEIIVNSIDLYQTTSKKLTPFIKFLLLIKESFSKMSIK